MLALISSIPTTVREGFDVQDLPARASTLSEEQMKKCLAENASRGEHNAGIQESVAVGGA